MPVLENIPLLGISLPFLRLHLTNILEVDTLMNEAMQKNVF